MSQSKDSVWILSGFKVKFTLSDTHKKETLFILHPTCTLRGKKGSQGVLSLSSIKMENPQRFSIPVTTNLLWTPGIALCGGPKTTAILRRVALRLQMFILVFELLVFVSLFVKSPSPTLFWLVLSLTHLFLFS